MSALARSRKELTAPVQSDGCVLALAILVVLSQSRSLASVTELSHLFLKSPVELQSAVQRAGFTGLCFQKLLLAAVGSRLIAARVSVLPFVSLRVMPFACLAA